MDEPNAVVNNEIINSRTRDRIFKKIIYCFLLLELVSTCFHFHRLWSMSLENKEPEPQKPYPSFEPTPSVFVVFVDNEQCAFFDMTRVMTIYELLKRLGG